jgi:hypothetical protein
MAVAVFSAPLVGPGTAASPDPARLYRACRSSTELEAALLREFGPMMWTEDLARTLKRCGPAVIHLARSDGRDLLRPLPVRARSRNAYATQVVARALFQWLRCAGSPEREAANH